MMVKNAHLKGEIECCTKTATTTVDDHLPQNLTRYECSSNNTNRPLDMSVISLSIKTGTCSTNLPHFTSTANSSKAVEESPCYTPSVVSPASSAFVSAIQSPYVSPRTLTPSSPETDYKEQTQPELQQLAASPPVSNCGSLSEDIPSSSYTPVPERSDWSDDGKLKHMDCISDPTPSSGSGSTTTSSAMPPAPRISFSFPVPRLSFARASVSPAVNAKLRSCDIFIGYHGQNANLVRYCKWVKSELELQGIACFLADRARYADCQSHDIADRVICSVSIGIVVISSSNLFNPFTMEEVRFFTQKKNLIPMFFDTQPMEIASLVNNDKHCRETIEGLLRYHNEFKLEAKDGDWRSCVSRAAVILRSKLGRQSVTAKEIECVEAVELPFPRNKRFVGRQKEIMDMEAAFFGSENSFSLSNPLITSKGSTSGQSEGFADEETDMDTSSTGRGERFISLELEMCRTKGGLGSDAQFEAVKSRHSLKRSKYKKSRSGKDKSPLSSVICISGPQGLGKTELALEFAYRYFHRYKMVLWVGGEARYLRQNILNLSIHLGVDVSADSEKERGKIRNFEEQEYEAFKRIKRELFRDMPYLIIIDNLETENDWWEGKDLHDLIPRTTGGTHVIITTRLSKIMNFDVMPLETLPLSDAMMLLKGGRNKEYPSEEEDCLNKFEEKLGRSTFGLSIVDSLLTELAVSPSALFEAVQQQALFQDMSARTFSNASEKQLCRSDPFLIKILTFCFSILDKLTLKQNCLGSRMLQVGSWFGPSPIPANLLVTAAKHIPETQSRIKKWGECLIPAFFCCGCPLVVKSEEEHALLLVRLGLARRVIRQSGLWIQFHPITTMFARTRDGTAVTHAAVLSIMKMKKSLLNSDHLWASAFLVFGFKSEPPLVQLKAMNMVFFIKKTAIPLALEAFTTFSRCSSALEVLKVSTGVLEDMEKSFVSQIQDWRHGSRCWNRKLHQSNQKVDECAWEEVTLLKATLLEMRARLLLRGGYFDSAEELCRTCISIRTVMLGHNHAQTLAAQETLAKLVRLRSKI